MIICHGKNEENEVKNKNVIIITYYANDIFYEWNMQQISVWREIFKYKVLRLLWFDNLSFGILCNRVATDHKKITIDYSIC